MFSDHSAIIVALTGICVFMFGMTIASENLQKLAADRMRDLLAKLSDKPFTGVLVGVVLTALIQSSGAVTSMLVGLGTARVITLRQVMGVILGTAVGTTITVQILSLNVAQYGMPLFAVAFSIYFLAQRRVVRRTMGVVMGFGLLFWGLEIIGIGTAQLKNAEFFLSGLDYLKENPVITILATALFTAIVHSSAATVGFAMSLGATGMISLTDAMFWVYGANIGTTATALLASAGGNYVGRRVAWAHCMFKVLGVVAFYYFTDYFAAVIGTDNMQRDVANAHTVFNVMAAILFFPFIKYGATLVEKMITPAASEKEFSAKYIERGSYESSSVVLAHAEREALRMADIVFGMIRDSLTLFRGEDKDLRDDIRVRDDRVDLLQREISLYLTQYMDSSEGHENEQMIRLISFASDLESAADVIDKNILVMAAKKCDLKLNFSAEGWADLELIQEKVTELANLSIVCFQRRDKDLASKVLFQKREIRKLEKNMREGHIQRLIAGKQQSINTSSIHLDVLSEYRRVAGLMSNHVYSMMKDSDRYNIFPRRET